MTTSDKLNYLNQTKSAIKTAIEAKGVQVGTSTFRQYADKISQIVSGDNNFYFYKPTLQKYGITNFQKLQNKSYQGVVSPNYDKLILSSNVGQNANVQTDNITPTSNIKIIFECLSSTLSPNISFNLFKGPSVIQSQQIPTTRTKYEYILEAGNTYSLQIVVNNFSGYIHVFDIHLEEV